METIKIDETKLGKLGEMVLRNGAHRSFEAGACAMEAVAWLAGEAHSDHPQCACPVGASALRQLNDRIPDDKTRTELLLPLLPRLVGSRADLKTEIKRAFVAADFAVRVFAPAALDARGLTEHAAKLRACDPIVDVATARAAEGIAKEERKAAYAAADAAAAAAAYAADAAAYAAAYAADAAAYAAAAAAYAADAAAYAAAAAAAYAADARKRLYAEGVRMINAMLVVRP